MKHSKQSTRHSTLKQILFCSLVILVYNVQAFSDIYITHEYRDNYYGNDYESEYESDHASYEPRREELPVAEPGDIYKNNADTNNNTDTFCTRMSLFASRNPIMQQVIRGMSSPIRSDLFAKSIGISYWRERLYNGVQLGIPVQRAIGQAYIYERIEKFLSPGDHDAFYHVVELYIKNPEEYFSQYAKRYAQKLHTNSLGEPEYDKDALVEQMNYFVEVYKIDNLLTNLSREILSEFGLNEYTPVDISVEPSNEQMSKSRELDSIEPLFSGELKEIIKEMKIMEFIDEVLDNVSEFMCRNISKECLDRESTNEPCPDYFKVDDIDECDMFNSGGKYIIADMFFVFGNYTHEVELSLNNFYSLPTEEQTVDQFCRALFLRV